MSEATKEKVTCNHALFNCNCWYVVTAIMAIHRADTYREALAYKNAQPDAEDLKLTPWNGRPFIERKAVA